MFRLTAPDKFSFFWNADPKQWELRAGDQGQKNAPLMKTPFVIGRARDCQLVLPRSSESDRGTSRWHCHIIKEDGKFLLGDGSLKEVPETGQRKPSAGGTFRNSKKIKGAETLKDGDVIGIGSYTFKLEWFDSEPSFDLDPMLVKLSSLKPRSLASGDAKVGEGFSRLQELFKDLHDAQGTDEALQVILTFAMARIRGAEVAAILTSAKDGFDVRMAWSRSRGRIFDMKFSSALVKKMPDDQALLLQASVVDQSKSQIEERISSGLVVPLQGQSARLGVLYLDNRGRGLPLKDEDLYLANALASMVSLQLVLEKQVMLVRVEQNMRQYFGPDVVRMIVEESRQGRSVALGVRECEATMVFVDIKGFSAFSHKRSPEQVSGLLNSYYQAVSASIQKHGGHVDKFIGDGVLGVFGAQPLRGKDVPRSNHAAQAVRASREIITAWGGVCRSTGIDVMPLRIGINTGRVVVGNVGFPGRMEYSVIGDAVNLASRMEKQASADGIALTDATCKLLGEEFMCRDVGVQEIKGFGPVNIWTLV